MPSPPLRGDTDLGEGLARVVLHGARKVMGA
jgi:hypothetical protein